MFNGAKTQQCNNDDSLVEVAFLDGVRVHVIIRDLPIKFMS